jgi:hypothetical protein
MSLQRGLSALCAFAMVMSIALTGAGHAHAVTVPAADTGSGMQVGGFFVQPGVELLKRFGIIQGDPDGNMRLGETITRGEIAKVIVVAMGQESAALLAAAEPPAFPDVADHWARGYIAVARKLGVAGGYDDNTFRPRSPVTNAEVLTMLLRATGLQPTGPWPDSYLNAARGARVLVPSLDETLLPAQLATRGVVFLMAERTFTTVKDAWGTNLLQRVFGYAPPQVDVTLLGAAGGVTMEPKVIVVGRAERAVMVQVNGAPVWPNNGEFRLEVPLLLGRNEIFVLATDHLGNTARQVVVVERQL